MEDFDTAYLAGTTPNSKGNTWSSYFIKQTEAIELSDRSRYAIASFWTKSELPFIKKIAESLGCNFKFE